MSSTANPPANAPSLKRSLTLWDLILYGIIVIQPVAPMSVFGVLSDRGHGHVCYDHPDRDGGDAVYRSQLRPHGARISKRGFSLHLRRTGNQSRARLRDGLEHGDGLHSESHRVHHLVQPAGRMILLRAYRIGCGRFSSHWHLRCSIFKE